MDDSDPFIINSRQS